MTSCPASGSDVAGRPGLPACFLPLHFLVQHIAQESTEHDLRRLIALQIHPGFYLLPTVITLWVPWPMVGTTDGGIGEARELLRSVRHVLR